MCWCFPFNLSANKKPRTPSSAEKKRRVRPAADQEKPTSKDAPKKKRPKEPGAPPSPRRERDEARPRPRPQYQQHRQHRQHRQQHQDISKSKQQYRPELNVQVPHMWHRSVDDESANSSEEMLLNPRPHRSPHVRQRHPKRTSQTTLRGRGAKRDPPNPPKSKKNLRHESSKGWSLFAPASPRPQRREHNRHAPSESSPRSHRSSRHHTHDSAHRYQELPESSSSRRHHRSRQPDRQPPTSTRHARSRTPNTAIRRVPDRRFAVLAATNQALEDLRREAFAQPSPPPRRERLQRYQGATIPSSSIPFHWDCVSSEQTSGENAEASTRRRHPRR